MNKIESNVLNHKSLFSRLDLNLLLLILSFVGVSISFFGLMISHIISDYSVLNVFQNSHQLKPLIYKISGVWGNHEGSMLLWLWLFSVVIAFFSYLHKDTLNKVMILAFSTIQLIFGLFIIIFASPFIRIFPIPIEGLGLNPLLQDIGLALHPPFLYMGYVVSIIPYSYAVSWLFYKKIQKSEVRLFVNYSILSWSLLSIGILLGSWWAYRELGWGGFWYWDPVENISLIPWFLLTAQFHIGLLLKKRDMFPLTITALSLSSFIASIFGTFLVRSGLLMSVHSFAGEGARAGAMFYILITFSLVNLVFFLLNCRKIYEQKQVTSTESGILSGNLLLVLCSVTIILSIIYPVIYNYFNHAELSVDPDYFNSTIIPLFSLAIIFTANFSGKIRSSLVVNIILSAIVIGVSLLFLEKTNFVILFSLASAIFLMISIFRNNKLSELLKSKNLAHLSIVCLVISILLLNQFGNDSLLNLKIGEKTEFMGKEVSLEDVKYGYNDNYIFRKAILKIHNISGKEIILEPEARLYPVERTQTAEAFIYHHLLYDIYALIGDLNEEKELIIRIYYRPMILFVWLSVILMAIAGLTSFTKRFSRKNSVK